MGIKMRVDVYSRGPIWRYGVAIAGVLLAVLAQHMLIPLIGLHAEYVTIFPAILIVALMAGRNPAILTGVLGGPAVALVFKPVLSPHVLIEILIVIGTAVLAGWLAQRLHNARAADRQILESIPGMVFTTRADGYCDFQSRQWADYTGVPAEEQLGDRWNNLLHPDDRVRALEVWRAAVNERAPYDIEFRVRRRDGQHEWFKVRGKPIRNAEGRIVRWFGGAVNIDAFRRTQEDLLDAKGTHIAQVFMNLLDNALKYLDPNRPGAICVEGFVEKAHALYWVSDNGIGIDPKHEQKVFDIFYRIDSSTGDGEGIGLSVVKRMVERNGGQIWLVSEKDKGSNFFVALPLPPDGCKETERNSAQAPCAVQTA